MKPVTVRGVRIGEGIPKICVPIMGRDVKEIRKAAADLREAPCDMVEWRADAYRDATDPEKLSDALHMLREELSDKPLLFTYRTEGNTFSRRDTAAGRDTLTDRGGIHAGGADGWACHDGSVESDGLTGRGGAYADGSADGWTCHDSVAEGKGFTDRGGACADDEYVRVNTAAIESGCADIIDAEVISRAASKKIINKAHRHHIPVIGSCHDFYGTPDRDGILKILKEEDDSGADILKVAVTPKSEGDVLTLLCATYEMTNRLTDKPVISMSMSGMGVISRVAGEMFGSAVTFGYAGEKSAPGQLAAGKLKEVLDILHEAAAD